MIWAAKARELAVGASPTMISWPARSLGVIALARRCPHDAAATAVELLAELVGLVRLVGLLEVDDEPEVELLPAVLEEADAVDEVVDVLPGEAPLQPASGPAVSTMPSARAATAGMRRAVDGAVMGGT